MECSAVEAWESDCLSNISTANKTGRCPCVALQATLFQSLLSSRLFFTPTSNPLLRTMPRFTLSTFVALAIASSRVYAQDSTTPTTSSLVPLASKHFDYNDLVRLFPVLVLSQFLNTFIPQPYQADSDNGVRGTQFGYNRCNSTTENQKSLCQTAILNSIDGEFRFLGIPPLVAQRQTIFRFLPLGTSQRSHDHC